MAGGHNGNNGNNNNNPMKTVQQGNHIIGGDAHAVDEAVHQAAVKAAENPMKTVQQGNHIIGGDAHAVNLAIHNPIATASVGRSQAIHAVNPASNNNPPAHQGGAAPAAAGAPAAPTNPVAVADWTNKSYQEFLKEHPNPGHSPGTPKNAEYAAWLQQHPNAGQAPSVAAGSAAPTGSSAGSSDSPSPVYNIDHGNHNTDQRQKGSADQGGPGQFFGPEGTGTEGNFFGPKGTDPTGNQPDPDQPAGKSGQANDGFAQGSGGLDAGAGAKAPVPSYVVKSGDTMSGIAAAHGMSVGQLEALNPQIKNPNMIFSGESIKLGQAGSAPAGGLAAGSPSHSGFAPGGDVKVVGGAVQFPSSSTYPPVDKGQPGGLASSGTPKHAGWAAGDGGLAADPVNISYVGNQHHNTNPTEINGHKHGKVIISTPE